MWGQKEKYENVLCHLKDLKTGNIQHTDEELSFHFCVQSLVDSGDQPTEHATVQRLGESVDGVVYL